MTRAKNNEGGGKAALLVDCGAGKAGEVVELPPGEIAALVASGVADDSTAAVEYAEQQAESLQD